MGFQLCLPCIIGLLGATSVWLGIFCTINRFLLCFYMCRESGKERRQRLRAEEEESHLNPNPDNYGNSVPNVFSFNNAVTITNGSAVMPSRHIQPPCPHQVIIVDEAAA